MSPPASPVAASDRDPLGTAADWFSRRRAGDMSRADDAAFQAWLAADQEHPAAYRALERQWMIVGAVAQDPAILAAREEDHRRFDRASVMRRALAAAAAVLLAVTSGWAAYDSDLLRRFGFGHSYAQDFRNDVGQRSKMVLADGSIVTLDTDSEVRVRSMDATRSLELIRGRAFFKVAKDASRPFLVHADGRVVHAIGTAFAVRLDADDVSVTLVEGKVRVDQPRTLFARGRSADMTAGAKLEARGGEWSIDRFDPQRETSWLDGRLVFTHDSLATAVAEMNRYSARKLVFRGGVVPGHDIVGVFRTGDVAGLARAAQLNGFARIVSQSEDEIVLAAR